MKYAIVGETCVDVFVYGNCRRLSPEAPVPVFEPTHRVKGFGMAHNVLNNVRSIIKQKKEFRSKPIGAELITNSKKPIKTRYIDEKSNHMLMRVDENDSVERIKISSRDIGKILRNSSDIIISDYNKGFLHSVCYDTDFNHIRENTFLAKIYLDTKRLLTDDICRSVDFIKLNTLEYNNNQKDKKSESAICLENYAEKIIVTDSTGATYMGKHYPVKNVYNTIDVSGAGDTFISAFAIQYSLSLSVEESIAFANICASDVVNQRGVKTPRYNQDWDNYMRKL